MVKPLEVELSGEDPRSAKEEEFPFPDMELAFLSDDAKITDFSGAVGMDIVP